MKNVPKDMPNEVDLFSTLEAALNWMGISLKEFDKIIRVPEGFSKNLNT
ncbi:MAG: hypothetical protein JXP36_13150 [Bacteroidales bacterium]|nr:hypothetical protein [Bacteroidales bacterium]